MLNGQQYEPDTILDTSSFPESMVVLNVYDVSDGELFQRINKVTTANNNVLVGGIFHAGVEVYGKEWCYGVTEYGRSGVAAVYPRTHPQHTYKCSVPMGPTKFSTEEVDTLLIRLSQEWPGHEYDLLHHNCVNFSNALLHELGTGRVPGWVDRLAKTAAAIDITSKKVAEDTQQTIQLVRTFTSDLEQKARALTGDDAPEEWEMVKRESLKALDVARSESAKFAELAQAQAKDISEKAPEFLNAFGSSFFEGIEGLRKSVSSDGMGDTDLTRKTQELGEDLGEKAQVFREKAQEQVQALGSSLWQWGQDLQKTSPWGAAGQAPDIWPSVGSSTQAAYAEGTSGASAQKPTMKGLLDEDDDDLLSGPHDIHGTHGMVRSLEEKFQQQGLLDLDEEDGYSGNDLLSSSVRPVASSGRQASSVGKLEEVEAPLEWLSSSSRDAIEKKTAAPVVDLLD